jgi:GT2 family glycosyltransferase
MLRFTEHTDRIAHISDVLYSWRETATSTSVNPDSKPYAHDAGKTALDAHLKRRYGEYAHAEDSEYLFVYDARFDLLKDEPLVSIIIPTKNGADYVRRCVGSILEKSTYKNYEILILDNNSDSPDAFACFDELRKRDGRVRIIRAEFPFNWSKINNFGVRHAHGDVFVFLNNDTYVITPDWLERLAENALRPDVGAVGALLLYEDGTIQHAGVVVGMNHWADHVFKAMPTEHFGHGFVSPMISRDVLAVTGACMAVSRGNFNKVGGFNENFIVCGSDVEICVKLYKAGLPVLYDANVRLCHYESKTRDATDIPKIDFLLSDKVYEEFRDGRDPFYNRNLDGFSTTPRAAI